MKPATVTSAGALLILFGMSPVLRAADGVAPTLRGDQYNLAAAKTQNIHANDQVRLLGKYAAASEQPVPGAVIKEHAVAIRANTEQARKSYYQLSTAARKNPVISKQLAEIDARLAKVTSLLDELDVQSKQELTASKAVIAKTNALSQELKATHLASKVIDQVFFKPTQRNSQFSSLQSADYYFTGEGHFID